MQRSSKKSQITAFSLVELSVVLLIIGIIIAGISEGSILIRKYRLSTARQQTQNSPVSSMSDLVFWLETTSEKSFSSANMNNGDAVSAWKDINPQSTSPYTASASGTARPTYETNCIKGLPCLSFDGTTDYIEITNSFTFGDFTFFIVADIGTEGETGYLVHTVYSDLDTQGRIHMLTTGSDYIGFSQTYADGTVNLTNLYETSLTSKTYPHIFEAHEDSSEIYFYINGANGETTTTDIDPDEERYVDGFGFGGFHGFGTPSNFLSGKIAEVIFFDRALKSSEKSDIRDYLEKKWQ